MNISMRPSDEDTLKEYSDGTSRRKTSQTILLRGSTGWNPSRPIVEYDFHTTCLRIRPPAICYSIIVGWVVSLKRTP